VLPFENLGDPEDEYFADGITDEITSRLAQLPDIGVISRTSAMQYKGSGAGLRQIGQELGVQYILEGTIRWARQGNTNRVRITPQLIRVADDRHLWADNYERDLTQIFAVQAEIAGRVADALNIALGEADKSRLEASPTEDLIAYDYFLRGRDYYELGMRALEDESAINMLKRAVELDSTFSLAYTWLARAAGILYFHNPAQGRELLDLAKKSAEASFRVSQRGPEGHMAMGYYYYYGEKDYDLALRHFSSALVEQPNDADVIEAISYIQRRLGQWQASLKSMQRAAELDPRSIRKVIELQLSALALRQYDLARHYFDLGCEIEPAAQALYERESWRYIMAYGDTRQARHTIEQGRRLIGPGSLDEELEILDIYDRDYQSALRRRPTADAARPFDDFNYYLSKGWIYKLMGDQPTGMLHFDSARVEFENAVTQAPDFPLGHSYLAAALAGLGRYEDAIRECEFALRLFSDTEDALLYPMVLGHLATVYTLAGNYDGAIETLDTLLSMPFVYSVNTLKLDPVFDPLRDHPRFKALIEKYEKTHGT
ncbi:MAG: tetratricopeptide repeat protein, partial [Candidatus Zixiibacteriota bacterium]